MIKSVFVKDNNSDMQFNSKAEPLTTISSEGNAYNAITNEPLINENNFSKKTLFVKVQIK